MVSKDETVSSLLHSLLSESDRLKMEPSPRRKLSSSLISLLSSLSLSLSLSLSPLMSSHLPGGTLVVTGSKPGSSRVESPSLTPQQQHAQPTPSQRSSALSSSQFTSAQESVLMERFQHVYSMDQVQEPDYLEALLGLSAVHKAEGVTYSTEMVKGWLKRYLDSRKCGSEALALQKFGGSGKSTTWTAIPNPSTVRRKNENKRVDSARFLNGVLQEAGREGGGNRDKDKDEERCTSDELVMSTSGGKQNLLSRSRKESVSVERRSADEDSKRPMLSTQRMTPPSSPVPFPSSPTLAPPHRHGSHHVLGSSRSPPVPCPLTVAAGQEGPVHYYTATTIVIEPATVIESECSPQPRSSSPLTSSSSLMVPKSMSTRAEYRLSDRDFVSTSPKMGGRKKISTEYRYDDDDDGGDDDDDDGGGVEDEDEEVQHLRNSETEEEDEDEGDVMNEGSVWARRHASAEKLVYRPLLQSKKHSGDGSPEDGEQLVSREDRSATLSRVRKRTGERGEGTEQRKSVGYNRNATSGKGNRNSANEFGEESPRQITAQMSMPHLGRGVLSSSSSPAPSPPPSTFSKASTHITVSAASLSPHYEDEDAGLWRDSSWERTFLSAHFISSFSPPLFSTAHLSHLLFLIQRLLQVLVDLPLPHRVQ